MKIVSISILITLLFGLSSFAAGDKMKQVVCRSADHIYRINIDSGGLAGNVELNLYVGDSPVPRPQNLTSVETGGMQDIYAGPNFYLSITNESMFQTSVRPGSLRLNGESKMTPVSCIKL